MCKTLCLWDLCTTGSLCLYYSPLPRCTQLPPSRPCPNVASLVTPAPLSPPLLYFLGGRTCPTLCHFLLPSIRTIQLPSWYLQGQVLSVPSHLVSGGERCSATDLCLAIVSLLAKGLSMGLRECHLLNPLCLFPLCLYPTPAHRVARSWGLRPTSPGSSLGLAWMFLEQLTS